MDTLEFLGDVYSDFCSKNNLEHISADEQTNLNPKQSEWIEKFIELWNEAED